MENFKTIYVNKKHFCVTQIAIVALATIINDNLEVVISDISENDFLHIDMDTGEKLFIAAEYDMEGIFLRRFEDMFIKKYQFLQSENAIEILADRLDEIGEWDHPMISGLFESFAPTWTLDDPEWDSDERYKSRFLKSVSLMKQIILIVLDKNEEQFRRNQSLEKIDNTMVVVDRDIRGFDGLTFKKAKVYICPQDNVWKMWLTQQSRHILFHTESKQAILKIVPKETKEAYLKLHLWEDKHFVFKNKEDAIKYGKIIIEFINKQVEH